MACYAALDVGSNSVRLLVGDVAGGRVQPLRAELRSTRLLAGATSGWLQEEAVARTVAAVAGLAGVARDYRPRAIICVATSAAREARNPELLTHGIAARCGLDLAILTGAEEARLAYRGALAGLPAPARRPLVIDIGGGSTEFSWQDDGGLHLESVAVGAVRATEKAMDAGAIAAELDPVLARVRKGHPGCLIGTGGTVTTVAALELGLADYRPEVVHGTFLAAGRVEAWRRQLAAMSLEERRHLKGLQPERADIIVAGVTILALILSGLAADGIIASEADLLWGLLLAMDRGEKLACDW